MFLINGFKATLRQFNRTTNTSYYDDQNYADIVIKMCPYNIANGINFGIYTVPNAEGYYQVPRTTDVLEGDQIIYGDRTYTVLKVQDHWLFNRVENKVLAVK